MSALNENNIDVDMDSPEEGGDVPVMHEDDVVIAEDINTNESNNNDEEFNSPVYHTF